jgi:serine protease Do
MKTISKTSLAVLTAGALGLPAGWLFADNKAEDAEREPADRVGEFLLQEIEGDDELLRELLQKAAAGGGALKLELDGDQAEEFLKDGDAFNEKLKKLLENAAQLDADELKQELRDNPGARRLELDPGKRGMGDFLKFFEGQLEARPPTRNEKDHRSALSDWATVVEEASASTAEVLDADGKQVALATVVDERGYLVTKASELPSGRFNVVFGDGRKAQAKRLDVNEAWDLALLKIPGKGLTAAKLTDGNIDLGSFLAAPGTGGLPIATGVVSVLPRNLSLFERGFLGIGMEDDGETVRINEVYGRSAAARAGLKVGDEVLAIDGDTIDGSAHLAMLVGDRAPGEVLKIRYRRGGDEAEVEVKLGKRDRPVTPQVPHVGEYMGGRLSNNRDEFPNALQHDLTLAPEECGGPLVNLDGDVVGLNLARGGRVKSFAIPAMDLKGLLLELDSGRFSIDDGRLAERELEAVDREIADMERRLKRARERREAAERALEKAGEKRD